MRFVFSHRWPFVARSPRKNSLSSPRAVRFGADSCVDLALFGADETTAAGHRSDSERFSAALVAWRMLENASETKKSPNAMRMAIFMRPTTSKAMLICTVW